MGQFNLTEVKQSVSQPHISKVILGKCVNVLLAFYVIADSFFYHEGIAHIFYVIGDSLIGYDNFFEAFERIG